MITWSTAWTTAAAHDEDVWAAAVVGDRRTAVTVGSEGTAHLWDLADGRRLATWAGDGRLWSVTVADIEGRPHALIGSDWSLSLWDLTTLSPAGVLDGIETEVWAVAVAQLDGRPHALASDDDQTIRVWDLTTRQQTAALTEFTTFVMDAAVMGTDAVTSHVDGEINLWDLTTGSRTATFTGMKAECWSVDFDAAYVVGSGHDETVRVWSRATGEELGLLTGHEGTVGDVKLITTAEGTRVITGGEDGTIRTWNPATLKESGPLLRLPSPILALAPTPDGHLLTGYGDTLALLR
ncbi:WD40 repeat domain-containing protein [Herbidospora sp. RD11066]